MSWAQGVTFDGQGNPRASSGLFRVQGVTGGAGDIGLPKVTVSTKGLLSMGQGLSLSHVQNPAAMLQEHLTRTRKVRMPAACC